VRGVAFTADGRWLGIASGSGRPVPVDTATWHEAWTAAAGSTGPNTNLVFSPDGRTLVVGGSDGKQHVYDLSNGDLLATFADVDPQWTFVTFLPDGTHLAIARYDGSITIHALDLSAWIDRACAIANRDMTPAEWARLLPGRTPQPVCPQVRH
jgi:WD40 repeat protein